MKLPGILSTLFTRKPAKMSVPIPASLPRDKMHQFAIIAAQTAGGKSKWTGSSDDLNREYATAVQPVIQRAQDQDANNPDVRGFHRQRTSQVIGCGLRWSAAFKGSEVGMSAEEAEAKCRRLNRLRAVHSRMGGFDARGAGRTEAKLQEQSLLTTLVQGTCLVHRVWKTEAGRVLPLAIEIVPGSRLETPRDRLGDPLISFGIQYTDDRRTKIKGFWIRKPSRSVGANNFVWDYVYDYIPAEDGALMALTEIAGLDRSLPVTVALVRTLRNKNDFADSAVEAARAHTKRPIGVEVEPGANAWDRAAADNQQQLPDSNNTELLPVGTVTMGGMEVFYANPGEKLINLSAQLPDPDFKGFMEYQDSRCARGLNTSISRFSRQVNSSYSGGRMEEQHDEPAVAQLRETFANAWQRVHEWFMDAALLAGVESLPNYATLRAYYTEPRITPPGKEHINPVDTANARKIGYALRTLSPQQACEEDGKDLEQNLDQWADAIAMVRRKEKDKGLSEGTLDFLLDVPLAESEAAKEEQRQDKFSALPPVRRIAPRASTKGGAHAFAR